MKCRVFLCEREPAIFYIARWVERAQPSYGCRCEECYRELLTELRPHSVHRFDSEHEWRTAQLANSL